MERSPDPQPECDSRTLNNGRSSPDDWLRSRESVQSAAILNRCWSSREASGTGTWPIRGGAGVCRFNKTILHPRNIRLCCIAIIALLLVNLSQLRIVGSAARSSNNNQDDLQLEPGFSGPGLPWLCATIITAASSLPSNSCSSSVSPCCASPRR